MPVEHENKFVLKDAPTLLERCRETMPEQRLQQFYLTKQARFRRVETDDEPVRHLFTFKVPTAGGLLEIEREIDPADYALARGEASEVLTKSRFDLVRPDGHWSVDFLRDRKSGEVYFAMAEVEFPEGAAYEMPGFLVPHVALAVPHADNPFFANALLIDRTYARDALSRYLGRSGPGPG